MEKAIWLVGFVIVLWIMMTLANMIHPGLQVILMGGG